MVFIDSLIKSGFSGKVIILVSEVKKAWFQSEIKEAS